MELDKTTVGLSLILAVVVAMLVFSASLPVSGSDAEQQATVTKNITAVKIVDHTGAATPTVTHWNFSGQSGATVADPKNSEDYAQDIANNQSAVACLNNTNTAAAMTVYITAGAWTGSNVISSESWNVSDGTKPAGWNVFVPDDDVELTGLNAPAATLSANGNWSLWLKAVLNNSGSATSTFNVTCEL
jgi:hypothetical protein